MRLFDTHCHFENADVAEISAIVERARAAGVERMMAVGGSALLNESAVAAARYERARGVICAVGYDRDQTSAERPALPMPGEVSTFRIAAYGEIGLDYYYSPENRRQQLELFGRELEEAARRDLPVVIHTREADDDTIAMLREIRSRGIIHCYTGSPEAARQYLDLGFYISISGIVTFRLADNVRETAGMIPDDRILIETDSPYLSPVPMRGKPNEPAFIRHTCEFLASLRKTPVEKFAELTFANAELILGGSRD